MADTKRSGLEQIRDEARKYARRTSNFGALASDVQVNVGALQDFVDTGRKLPNDGALDRLVKRLWRGGAVYVGHSDELRKAPREIAPMGLFQNVSQHVVRVGQSMPVADLLSQSKLEC
jgi:hypothetical protein